MAILSKGMKLGYKTGTASSYTNLTGLQTVPALGGSKDKVDVTTLADGSYKYIAGIKSFDDLEFTFIYDKDVYSIFTTPTTGLENLSSVDWEVEFPDGVKFDFSGACSVAVQGGEVNGAITFTLTIVLGSDITVTYPSTQL